MLFSLGHGQHVVLETASPGLAPAPRRADAIPLSEVIEHGSQLEQRVRDTDQGAGLAPAPARGGFHYLFPDAENAAETICRL